MPPLLLLLLIIAIPLTSAANPARFARVEGILEEWSVPHEADDVYQYLGGLWSVTTVQDGNRSSNTHAFGYSNIPHQIPVTRDSHFPIASNTKLYTTVAIYQLYERGKLDVDADIATMLDAQDFENFGLDKPRTFCPRVGGGLNPFRRCEKITLRNLMSMSSGIYPALNCDAKATSPDQCNPVPFLVNMGSIGKTVGTFLMQPLMFQPGTAYHYSNPNFVLAAYFVEKYSGQTFREYLQENIFSRIGLKDSHFDFYNEALMYDPKRVEQYVKYYDNTTNPLQLISVGKDILQLDLGSAAGTGGVISTASDYVTFWYSIFNKTTLGAPLVSEASQKAILKPWSKIGSRNDWIYPDGSKRSIWNYYTQGTTILCEAEHCPDGPRWIAYTGGTITVHTANVMDCQTYHMAQVWTSTLVGVTDRETFAATF